MCLPQTITITGGHFIPMKLAKKLNSNNIKHRSEYWETGTHIFLVEV